MPFERRDLVIALQKKGFRPENGDHTFFTFYTEAGQKTSVWTKTSLGTKYKTISDNLIGPMARQCGMNKRQFEEYVACRISHSGLEKILIETGRIKS
jgi:hypothetical protein